jgi:CxxC motif-containing protein (DUF1111 family)
MTLSGSFPKNFSTLREGLTKQDLRQIKVGYSLFTKPWVQAPASTKRRDGLGPYFNAVSCMSCHDGMGRGAPPAVRHINEPSLIFKSNSPQFKELYGSHLSPKSVPGLKQEVLVSITSKTLTKYKLTKPIYKVQGKVADVSPRISSHLAGLGLLEKIDELELYKNLKRSQGKISLINGKVGRFGWKASQTDLKHQVSAAFSSDMGITSHDFPEENCQSFDLDCLNIKSGHDEEGVEIRKDHLGFVVKLMRSIQAPVPLFKEENPKIERALKTFKKINCHSCHRPDYLVEGKVIRPYTDLLLHDMGEELADVGTGENSRYWRTPPLWGLGSTKVVNGHTRLMHDGRAKDVREAILWHFGEARQSRKLFLELSTTQQQELINFIKVL